MKIGIDIQAEKGLFTGLGVYVKNLRDQFLKLKPEDIEFRFYSKKDNKDLNTANRIIWENISIPSKSLFNRIDLLHIPAFSPAFFKFCPLVVTVHDIIGKLFPNQPNWPSRFYWGSWLPHNIKKADIIISDSEKTKNDLMNYLGIPENKISVVYASGHEGFTSKIDSSVMKSLRDRFGIRNKYFIFVGSNEPRKNILRIIEGVNRMKDYQIVIVGKTEYSSFGNVVYCGYLKKEELNQLYCGAEALVFPSLYEGFGIPILEAMASGTPVITSNCSSTPEVAGDAGILVDPLSLDQIYEAMSEISHDRNLRKKLISKGFERIKNFSWEKTAKETIKIYRSVLNGK